ncbi:hypothetical protein LCGC14_3028610, partial [marine sediment metagenome]
QDAINKDIVGTYAGLDLLGYMGDPRDKFNDSYRSLDELNNFYWEKYTSRPDHNSFIRVIKNYDQSFFDHLKSLIPARAKPVIGTLVEPHILERYKYKWSPLGEERNDYQTNLYKMAEPTFSSDYSTYDTAILQINNIEEAEYLTYIAVLDVGLAESSSYYVGEQQVIDMVYPIQDNGLFEIVTYYSSSNTSRKYKVTELLPGNWYLQYQELQSRIWYNGTKNTKDTTVDGKDPVEISFTNPNKLKATDQGPSKITVE